jgi:RNA polymerase sigma-54 factor
VIGVEYQLGPRLDVLASPALIAASEMLELPAQLLESMVQEALDQNPVLERFDAAECAVCQDRWPTRCLVCSPPGALPRRVGGASQGEARDPRPECAAPQTDAEALLIMVRTAVRVSEARVAEYVVASLDQHGRLDQDPLDMAAALGVDEAAVLRVLSAVRQLGPPGVGATSPAECLLLQLDRLDLDDASRALARRVIAHHLPALARGHFAGIAAALHVDQRSVAEVLALIRERLRPYPAFDGGAPQPNTRIVPDLVIRERPGEAGEFQVELVEPRRLRLGIAPEYLRRLEQPGPGEASHLRGLVTEARGLLGRLADRWETLRLVATCTVERQKDFIREGPSGLQPLTRAEVAEMLGMHQSTVSRATAGRYAMLPSHRIVPMAAFYSASGGLADELRRIVAAEDRPLSDGELADRLRAQGYAVARRTVTKYRMKLGIAAVTQR